MFALGFVWCLASTPPLLDGTCLGIESQLPRERKPLLTLHGCLQGQYEANIPDLTKHDMEVLPMQREQIQLHKDPRLVGLWC